MSNHILALLIVLAVFNLQVFTQGQICTTPQDTPSSGPFVEISLFNDRFEPDCLIITDNQTVRWVWKTIGFHTVTTNNGPFGSCSSGNGVIDELRIPKGSEISHSFRYNPDNLTANEIFYKCRIHCGSSRMYGKITIIPA